MKNLIIILFVFLIGCTYIKYNAETKDFTYLSTKECESCEASYIKGDLTVKVGKVKAFQGQQAITGTIKDIIKPSIK